jgi:hypothetical protein
MVIALDAAPDAAQSSYYLGDRQALDLDLQWYVRQRTEVIAEMWHLHAISSDKSLGEWTSLTGARVACFGYPWKLLFLCCVIKKYATKRTNKPALSLGVHSFPE